MLGIIFVIAPIGVAQGDSYIADFTHPVGDEWSHSNLSQAPRGWPSFLGEFGNDVVALKVWKEKPGPVTLSFDLLIINSWDGVDAGYGPDIWQVEVDGGEILLKTTFSNLEEYQWQQSFPNTYGGGSHPAATGAQEVDSLGYEYYGDSIYHLEFKFDHGSGPITFLFSATGLQDLSDESWGLSNLRVEGARVRGANLSCPADQASALPDSEADVETLPLEKYLHQPDRPMDFETGEGFPEWWTEEDTRKFLDALPEALEEEVKDAATEAAIERAIERATRKLIARKLAEGEARIVRDRLIRCGKSPEAAERIAKRLAQRLQKEYLYKRPSLLTRIIPFKQGIDSLRKLLKSPKSWVRGKIGKVFTKGLGKLGGRVFAVAGLADDLYTIGKACWLVYQVNEAEQGAEAQMMQCEETHQDLIDFRAGMDDDQRRQIDELYRREQEYFQRAQQGQLPIVEP